MLAPDLVSPPLTAFTGGRGQGRDLDLTNAPLSSFLADAAERWPDDPCRIEDLELTYQGAWLQVLRIATWLQQNGVSRGDKVLMAVRQRPELQLITLAVAHIGAVVTLLSPRAGADRFREVVAEATPACMFLDRSSSHLRPEAEDVLTVWLGDGLANMGVWDADYAELMATDPAWGMRFPGTAHDPAFLVYANQRRGAASGDGVLLSHNEMHLLLASQAARGSSALDPLEFFQQSAREHMAASATFAALAAATTDY